MKGFVCRVAVVWASPWRMAVFVLLRALVLVLVLAALFVICLAVLWAYCVFTAVICLSRPPLGRTRAVRSQWPILRRPRLGRAGLVALQRGGSRKTVFGGGKYSYTKKIRMNPFSGLAN